MAAPRSSRWSTAALVVLLASALPIGVWASVAPRHFYDSFPGLGWTWIAVDGPFNEHLVRDVGGGYLALATITVVALLVATRTADRAAGAVWFVAALPHLLYHVGTADLLGSGAQVVANLGGLAATVALPLVLLLAPRPATSGERGGVLAR